MSGFTDSLRQIYAVREQYNQLCAEVYSALQSTEELAYPFQLMAEREQLHEEYIAMCAKACEEHVFCKDIPFENKCRMVNAIYDR